MFISISLSSTSESVDSESESPEGDLVDVIIGSSGKCLEPETDNREELIGLNATDPMASEKQIMFQFVHPLQDCKSC